MPATADRNMLFLSHANPEDNEFTLWLATQLANQGYPVWCDLTKLLGGEDFWADIQDALGKRTTKFIFVLSRNSNYKDGALQELAFAKGVARKFKGQIKDFILTARIDDIPYDEIDIRIYRQNHIGFHPSWAQGLAQLLQKLEEDHVQKQPGFCRESVCSWWRNQFSADQGVVNEPEELLSNWFTVENLPPTLNVHVLCSKGAGPVDIHGTWFPYPAVWIKDASFLTFARADDFSSSLGDNLIIERTKEHTLNSVVSSDGVDSGPKHLAQLLRLAWDARLTKSLLPYTMANNQPCFYFSRGMVPDDSIHFINADGKKSWRGVVGYKSVRKDAKRIWHFGISGKPIIRPDTLFVVKGHVLFSDDGLTLWSNKDAMARARRNQCKNWWNDDWRDRLLATTSYLADGNPDISFPLGSDVAFTLAKLPARFESPVTYRLMDVVEKEEFSDYEFEEEDDEEPDDETASSDEDDPDA